MRLAHVAFIVIAIILKSSFPLSDLIRMVSLEDVLLRYDLTPQQFDVPISFKHCVEFRVGALSSKAGLRKSRHCRNQA